MQQKAVLLFPNLGPKHRKNCECCPGHYLIVNHYSSMSWFKFHNLSVTVKCVTNLLNHSLAPPDFVFHASGQKQVAKYQKHTPKTPITARENQMQPKNTKSTTKKEYTPKWHVFIQHTIPNTPIKYKKCPESTGCTPQIPNMPNKELQFLPPFISTNISQGDCNCSSLPAGLGGNGEFEMK